VRALPVVMQDDGEFLYQSTARTEQSLARARSLGVDYIRVTAGWDTLTRDPTATKEPKGFEAYAAAAYPQSAFTSLDRIVRLAPQYGMRVMIDLAFWAPQWASRGVPTRGHVDVNVRQFSLFAFAMATRYDGSFVPPGKTAALPRVKIFTIWNEPNEIGFWGPMWRKVSGGRFVPEGPHRYRQLVRSGYGAIKSVQPDSTVLIGGLSSHGVKPEVNGSGSMPPLQFVREMACVDAKLRPLKRVECRNYQRIPGDGFSYHPYSLEYPPNAKNFPGREDNAPIGELPKLTSLLDRLVKMGRLAPGDRRVWLTEFGYETNPPDPGTKFTLQDQVDFLPWADYLSERDPDVVTFSQFLLRDPPVPKGAPRFNGFHTGLLLPNGKPKPAYSAFKAGLHVERRSGGRVLAFGHVRHAGKVQSATLEWRAAKGGAWHIAGTAATAAGGIVRDFAVSPGNVFLRWAKATSAKHPQYRFSYQIAGVSHVTVPTDLVTP
jgi:Cellulase (glycosyl hydrolase family 5)